MKMKIPFLLLASAQAAIPPHPKSDLVHNKKWVPVEQYRRQMGVDFQYKPEFLNPELCRFETEEVCRELDKSHQEHAHRTLEMVQGTKKFRVLVLLLQFEDHKYRAVHNHEDIALLFNDKGINTDLYPTGSVKSYFHVNSHGSLDIEANVIPWVVVEGSTEEKCNFGNSGLDKKFQKCFWPILDKLDQIHAQDDNSFNWENYDRNGDNFLDSLVVMHSGYGAEWGEIDPNEVPAQNRIWSHSIGPQVERWQSSVSNVGVGSYSVTSAFSGYQGGGLAPIGILIHEMIHTMGIPDLFDLSREDHDGGVGSYSIMSDVWGYKNDPAFPGFLDPWSKMQLGWLTPIPLRSNGRYQMRPSETYPDVFIIDSPYPDGEYLLLENRLPIQWDDRMSNGGAATLIWHIDEKVIFNTKAGGSYQEGWPENGNHYQVAVVQADGNFDLEQDNNMGDIGDFFVKGLSFGPGNEGEVQPNTDSYQDGIIRPTGIEIFDFNTTGVTVGFSVKGLREDTAAGSKAKPPPPKPMVEGQCTIIVNSGRCPVLMERVEPDESCDCWNFCGNGVVQECCEFGKPCHVSCHGGGLVAGCTADTMPTKKSKETPDATKEIPNINEFETGDIDLGQDSAGSHLFSKNIFVAALSLSIIWL